MGGSRNLNGGNSLAQDSQTPLDVNWGSVNCNVCIDGIVVVHFKKEKSGHEVMLGGNALFVLIYLHNHPSVNRSLFSLGAAEASEDLR